MPEPRFWSMASYPGWVQDTIPPTRIDWASTTHVLHFGRYPTGTGDVVVGDMQATANHAPLVTAAHAAGRNALLVIGGEGCGAQFATAASDPTARARLVGALAGLASTYGYDGVDVDWEEDVPANEAAYVALHADLRTALPPSLLLTTDVVSGLVPGRIAARVLPYVDSVNVMSYWSDGRDQYAHYRSAGIPAAKLVIGLGIAADPTYVDHTPAAVASKVELVEAEGCRGTEYWHVGEMRDSLTDPRLQPLREMVATGVQIVGRSTWGAQYGDGVGPAPIPAPEVWLHHTDTAPPADSVAAEYAAMRALDDIGQARFGAGISYTWCVMPSGRVYQGHGPSREGTHTYGHNSTGRAVALVGDHTTAPPTQAQVRAVAALLVEAKVRGWTVWAALTGGHRDVVTTACPGDGAYPWMAPINRIAGEGVAFALDYSAGRPTAAQVIAAGYVGVIRYVGFDPAVRPKCITAAEYTDMTSHGVPVALVYEDAAGDMLGGRSAGQVAAGRARNWAARTGFPASRPIYYACDTDIVGAAQMAAVLDYLRGAADVEGGPGPVGVYGEYDVVEQAAAAGVATWLWQTRAWSGGRLSTRAHIRQEIGTVYVGGVACDQNTILAADWGQTGAGEANDMANFTDADRTKLLNAADQVLGAIGSGQTSFAGTVKSVLGSVQSVYNLTRSDDSALSAGLADARTAILSTIATMPTAHLSDADRQALAADIVSKVNELGVRIDDHAVLDALAARLVA